MTNRRFMQNLEIVTTVHFALLALFIFAPIWSRMFHPKPNLTKFTEFTVAVPPEKSFADDVKSLLAEQPKPKPRPEPKPKDVVKRPDQSKVKEPDSRPPPKNTNKNTSNIKSDNRKPVKTRMTEDEIREWLKRGAKPSDHTSIPADEEVRCLALIRQVLYDAWQQPGYDEAGRAVAELEIRFQRDGSLFGCRLVKKSGNEILDQSVLKAAASVHRIQGLTPAFLSKFQEVTIEFKVEAQ